MEKLPSTSYVRLVDIWLICGQLIAFIEVILLTLRELYNEEDEINHHGLVRKVTSTSITSVPAPTLRGKGINKHAQTSKVNFKLLFHNKPHRFSMVKPKIIDGWRYWFLMSAHVFQDFLPPKPPYGLPFYERVVKFYLFVH